MDVVNVLAKIVAALIGVVICIKGVIWDLRRRTTFRSIPHTMSYIGGGAVITVLGWYSMTAAYSVLAATIVYAITRWILRKTARDRAV